MTIVPKLIATLFAVLLLGGCALGPTAEGVDGDQSASKVDTSLDTARQYASADQLSSPQLAATELYPEQVADAVLEEPSDPLEVFNRFLFAINETLDVFIFKPFAATYRFLLPGVVRDSFRNFLRNVETPVVLINDLLQGNLDRAETTAARFMLNSMVGVAGFADVAADSGYDYHDEDFGQTLGTWGAGPGPYLVLPILGPSSVRDAFGRLVDKFLNPLTYVAFAYPEAGDANTAMTVVRGIDLRSRNIETIEELQRDSVDFYARIRSVYLQKRVDEINNGKIREDLPTPGLSGGIGADQVSGTE